MDRDRAYLHDILEAARLAISYSTDTDEAAFLADVQRQDAVIRRLEIIGEAARRVSESFRLSHAGLPWAEMIGMRNLLIHEYDDVDMHVVWQTVLTELPRLAAQMEELLECS